MRSLPVPNRALSPGRKVLRYDEKRKLLREQRVEKKLVDSDSFRIIF